MIFKRIGIIIFLGILFLFIISRMSATSSDLTSFEGWYMHAYQYKHPDLETYLHVDDGKWTFLIKGEIAAQGKYAEQHENELKKQVDPWEGQQYKYDLITESDIATENGIHFSCYFEIDHGYKSRARGKMEVEYKYLRKSPEQQEEWERFLISPFVRIKEPKNLI